MSVIAIDSKVLVLNRSFLPIHVTTVKRAFCLVYLGVAKFVDDQYKMFDYESWADLRLNENDESIGLVGRTIKVPRVILLQVYDRIPKKQIRFSRFNVFSRDRNTCQYCNKTFARVDLNLDHVIPRSKGGLTTWENIVCSCVECNRKKGGRSPEQARMKLVRQPKKPHWTECLNLSMKNRFYKEWKPFLNVIDFSYWNVELEQ